jgi:cytochrome c biogenesis protein
MEAREIVVATLAEHFAAPIVVEREGNIHLFAQKAPYARFGVYVTHLSILVIFAGAIIGSLFGYKAYVNIVEGTEVRQVQPRGSDEVVDLGFSVRCDAFSVSYYAGSRRPQEFKSLLSVIDAGQVVHDKRPVIVNDPLTYKGITFYQSSYGPAGDTVYTFAVTARASGETVTVSGREKEHISLPGGGSLIPLGYAENYQNFGPAAQVAIDSGNHQHGAPFVVLQNFPSLDQQRGGAYGVALLGAKQRYFTGLQVAKDPGVWVVWLGCALLVIGSTIAFFVSHRRIWVTITPRGEVATVRIGGSAHRNQPAFALLFERVTKELAARLSS